MTNLLNISDKELLTNLNLYRRKEHESLIEILLHLGEIDSRKIYRDAGYSSLFDYCMRKLNYSESESMKRITVARCIREYEEVLEYLKLRKVSLTTLSLVARILKKDNIKEVLSNIAGKSKREVEMYLSGFKPTTKPREVIKPVTVKKTAKQGASLFKQATEPVSTSKQEPREKRYEVKFSINEDTMGKLQELKALNPKVSLEELFEDMLETLLDKKSPKCRQARRDKKKIRSILGSTALTKKKKDLVLKAGRYQCSYVSKEGVRCTCTSNLQVDHITPKALGGSNEMSNLRVLCGAHNRLMAEKKLGKDFMQRFY